MAPDQHSVFGGVTETKIWMGNNNDWSDNKKHSDYLAISLANMVSPVVRSQGYMVNNPVKNTPVAGIKWKNQSMLVANDWGVDICLNGLLTHSDPTYFFIFKLVFHLSSKLCHQRLTSAELEKYWYLPATLV